MDQYIIRVGIWELSILYNKIKYYKTSPYHSHMTVSLLITYKTVYYSLLFLFMKITIEIVFYYCCCFRNSHRGYDFDVTIAITN